MGKRGRSDLVSVEDGRAAAKEILDLALARLFKDELVTRLPYPGIGAPSDRPPFELYYVGTEAAFDLVDEFNYKARHLVILGPRGIGKSSDMRAVACYLYKSFHVEASRERLVSIWNMEAALDDVVSVVRSAILFAYLFPKASSTISVGKENEQVELEKEIGSISSIDEAVTFIKRRKDDHKEIFHFFVDSWEFLDEADSKGRPTSRFKQRVCVQGQLSALFAEGNQVWYAASAKSSAVKSLGNKPFYSKYQAFNEDQYAAYAASSILGGLGNRQKDIDFYTGRLPWFLDILCECCMKWASQRSFTARKQLRRGLPEDLEFSMKKFKELKAEAQIVTHNDQLVELLQDDHHWEAVLKLFREHKAMTDVQTKLDEISLDRTCYDIEEMGKMDRTYFIPEEKRYCSEFISRMYMEAFRAKEAQLQTHAGGTWMPYCRYLIQQGNINWSSIGWLVEDLVADVVAHRTVFLGQSLGDIAGLKLQEFREVPKLSITQLLATKPGNGYYYKPYLYSFPYVDGVLLYVDMEGKLHIIGLQVTVRVDEHLLSALLFMSSQYLRSWFPDIDTNWDKVKLHFVYVGCSKEHSDKVTEEDKPPQLKKLKGGKSCGVEAHKWTFVPMARALAALKEDELDVVQAVAAARKSQLPKLPHSVASLWHMTKAELEDIGAQYGIAKAKKADLIEELESLI